MRLVGRADPRRGVRFRVSRFFSARDRVHQERPEHALRCVRASVVRCTRRGSSREERVRSELVRERLRRESRQAQAVREHARERLRAVRDSATFRVG
jgi:hypothetical protein